MSEQHEVIAGTTQVYCGPNGEKAYDAYRRQRLKKSEPVLWTVNGKFKGGYPGPDGKGTDLMRKLMPAGILA